MLIAHRLARPCPAPAVIAAVLAPWSNAFAQANTPPVIVLPADPLAPGITAMIDAAIASGDEATVASVLKVARRAAPHADEEIDRREKDWKAALAAKAEQKSEEKLARLRSAGPLENWKGEVEAGAYRSTGTASSFGALGSLDLKREGLDWSHQLTARAELQTTNGETTAQRLFTAWQPNRTLGEHGYTYGLLQYEHDPFAGYDNRYTLGGGFGYRAFATDSLKVELEGGPAFRRVDYAEGPPRSQIAGRGSLNLDWKITPTLSLTQKTALYLEDGDGNLAANTALDTKLIGNLKARFSYNMQYERNPPLGASSLNTQSRATFVYGF